MVWQKTLFSLLVRIYLDLFILAIWFQSMLPLALLPYNLHPQESLIMITLVKHYSFWINPPVGARAPRSRGHLLKNLTKILEQLKVLNGAHH